MHPPSRARRILKWTGVGLSLFVLAMWITSMRVGSFVVMPGNRAYVQFYANGLNIGFTNFDVTTQLSAYISRIHVWSGSSLFWPDIEIGRPMGVHNELQSALVLPCWFLLLLTAIPTAWLWHRDRRLISASPDHRLCLRCGYDLTGNTSGVCPECGGKACPSTVLTDPKCDKTKPPPATV